METPSVIPFRIHATILLPRTFHFQDKNAIFLTTNHWFVV